MEGEGNEKSKGNVQAPKGEQEKKANEEEGEEKTEVSADIDIYDT